MVRMLEQGALWTCHVRGGCPWMLLARGIQGRRIDAYTLQVDQIHRHIAREQARGRDDRCTRRVWVGQEDRHPGRSSRLATSYRGHDRYSTSAAIWFEQVIGRRLGPAKLRRSKGRELIKHVLQVHMALPLQLDEHGIFGSALPRLNVEHMHVALQYV